MSAPPRVPRGAPTAASMWRVEVCVPEGTWRVVCEREDDPGADAWAPVDPLPAGTCLRVVRPDGRPGKVRVVAADGSAQTLVLPSRVRGHLGTTSCAAWDADPVAWWRGCTDGRYLLRVAGCATVIHSPMHRRIVRAACACARLSLPSWEACYPSDSRPIVAIQTAERWSYGEATLDEVRAARDEVRAARDAALNAWRSTAAAASGPAAAFASGAAFALHVTFAAFAANTASSASNTANAAANTFASERKRVLAECADLAREHIPLREVLVALVANDRA